MSEKAHLDAVVALLEAADAHPYTLQQLDEAAQLPDYYTEVVVVQRLGSGARRATDEGTTTQWRVVVRAVARRYGNAQEMRRRAGEALHRAVLTVGGESFRVARSITDDPIGPDDGWWSGVSEFTY